MRSSLAGFGFLVLTASRLLAADGILEINHACAAGPGCFPGDGPGYPVQINGIAGSSYRLTSDLRLNGPPYNESSTAIEIQNDGIALDLGGFSILGPCISFCTGVISGSGAGISAPFGERIEIRGGSVAGMGSTGIAIGIHGIVRDVRVNSNRGDGIKAGDGSLVLESTSARNGGAGISTGESCKVSGNAARLSGGAGITAGAASAITDNSVGFSGAGGISAGNGASVSGNTVFSNQGTGIETASGSVISRNVCYANGQSGTGDGIRAGVGSSVRENTARFNRSFGLALIQAGYAGNVIFGNNAGTVSGGNNLGENYCDSPTGTCP